MRPSAKLPIAAAFALALGVGAGRLTAPPDGRSGAEIKGRELGQDSASPINWVERPSQGPLDAQVVVVEYTDYQCPFCRRYHEETFGMLLDEYGDRIRYVVRHFPLENVHPFARDAARGAVCAQRQGRFWDYHHALFEGGVARLTREALIGHAVELDLDGDAFRACLDSETSSDVVSGDFVRGVNRGVRTTPSFFIDGRLVTGAQTLRTFRAVLDSALAAAGGL